MMHSVIAHFDIDQRLIHQIVCFYVTQKYGALLGMVQIPKNLNHRVEIQHRKYISIIYSYYKYKSTAFYAL